MEAGTRTRGRSRAEALAAVRAVVSDYLEMTKP